MDKHMIKHYLVESKCDYQIWENVSGVHNEPLILRDYLAGVEGSIKKAISAYISYTIPLPGKKNRYLLINNMGKIPEIRRTISNVTDSVKELYKHWDEAINEAKYRLKDKYNHIEYPDKINLDKYYYITFNLVTENDYIDVNKLLGEYSVDLMSQKSIITDLPKFENGFNPIQSCCYGFNNLN